MSVNLRETHEPPIEFGRQLRTNPRILRAHVDRFTRVTRKVEERPLDTASDLRCLDEFEPLRSRTSLSCLALTKSSVDRGPCALYAFARGEFSLPRIQPHDRGEEFPRAAELTTTFKHSTWSTRGPQCRCIEGEREEWRLI